MWKRIRSDKTDEFAFMRHRAAALLEEGRVREAMRLLAAINAEQVRRIKPLLMKKSEVAH